MLRASRPASVASTGLLSFRGRRRDASKKEQGNDACRSSSVRTEQADKAVYAFFVAGADLLKIAEISRVHRDGEGSLQGFQRKGIEATSRRSRSFWTGDRFFSRTPSFSRFRLDARFTQTRGEKPGRRHKVCRGGDIANPVSRATGQRLLGSSMVSNVRSPCLKLATRAFRFPWLPSFPRNCPFTENNSS